jgi:hypothetical protein
LIGIEERIAVVFKSQTNSVCEYINKGKLVEMCDIARDTCTDVDPDGLKEDVRDVIASKLRVGENDIYIDLLTFSQYDRFVLCYYY